MGIGKNEQNGAINGNNNTDDNSNEYNSFWNEITKTPAMPTKKKRVMMKMEKRG
jgi:hypothetical protein